MGGERELRVRWWDKQSRGEVDGERKLRKIWMVRER